MAQCLQWCHCRPSTIIILSGYKNFAKKPCWFRPNKNRGVFPLTRPYWIFCWKKIIVSFSGNYVHCTLRLLLQRKCHTDAWYTSRIIHWSQASTVTSLSPCDHGTKKKMVKIGNHSKTLTKIFEDVHGLFDPKTTTVNIQVDSGGVDGQNYSNGFEADRNSWTQMLLHWKWKFVKTLHGLILLN